MKRLLTIPLVALTMMAVSVTAAYAGDYEYLVLEKADGTKTYVSATDLKMTFEDGNLIIAGGESTISVSELTYMAFTNDYEETSISGVSTDSQSGSADYYTISGVKVLQPSAPGVYIIKKDGKTRKIVVR